ncbi:MULTISPECIES: MucR family transcriptional regulator [Methylobacterium]|uniref:Transcriptional regulatory protein ros n=1 Tax=Methylobacterium thuringiense TaxID=1003091 RepID=A0ABQ4TFY4_9HYPH|nr:MULTISPECIES: MucR family transcriptional regulator [Methylobacterium]TXN19691.1 MucR family transcriptional regulator [Methylobacterium sp. WL9]GJE53679.1 Transcriptional regulatory protein ros [Methylobacterium thuringiense]
MTSDTDTLLDHVALTRDIVSTFVANNSLQPAELPGLITAIHATLQQLSAPQAALPAERPVPAVSVRKSITQDYLVCLEDGKQFKSLKRHLRSKYNLTPDEYRARWNLPSDYPMVAPSYASERSQLAKAMGLGKERRAIAAE